MQTARLIGSLLVSASWLLLAGCQTTEPTEEANPTASLVVREQSVTSLGQAALEVFAAEGYTPVQNSSQEYVFEKPAGAMSSLAYGGLLDSTVWLRVIIRIRPLDDTAHQLTADAYRIRDRGGALEDQDHLGWSHARPYRSLLQAVVRKSAELESSL